MAGSVPGVHQSDQEWLSAPEREVFSSLILDYFQQVVIQL
jgi:hypothetical protein